MSIHENLNAVQRRNALIMEDVEAGTTTYGTAIDHSRILWEDFIRFPAILYRNESFDITPINKQNAAIIAQLANSDISATEAAAASNSLWIEVINKIRRPDMAQFNAQKYHSNNYLEPKF